MNDDFRDEVKEYMARFQDCSPEQLLEIMGQMRDFFLADMSEDDLQQFWKIRDALARPNTAPDPPA